MPSETTMTNLEAVFKPASIAVIGASTRPGTVGNDLLHNLIFSSFQGPVYPVNPKARSVLGIRTYSTLTDVPDPVDLAVVIVPAKAVLGIVDEAVARKVKAMVLISAGFKETGPEGAKLELELSRRVREAGIALVGPNCLGVINTDPAVSMNATFARKMPRGGKLAFISQSGALCTSVLDYAEERRMGFSKFISFGNKADVNEIQLLEYLGRDEQTSVIAMYLEDITNGRLFIETARRIFAENHKPMLCLKSGRSPEGAKAVSSHTGSLAGSDSVYDALLVQSGGQRVDTIAELFDYAAAYTTQPMPKGNRVAIITNAGGPGIMATDAAVRQGLRLADISETTRETLRKGLPEAAALRNPIDVIGDAHSDRYDWAVRHVMADPGVDMGMIILTPQSMTDIENIATIIPKAMQGINKPVVCAFMGARDVAGGAEILRQNGVPNYPFPEDAVRALAAMTRLVEFREFHRRPTPTYENLEAGKARDLIKQYLGDANERYLTQVECRSILKCYGLPLLYSEISRDRDEAAAIVERLGRPVAMKIMSPDIVHKYDAGGVMLKVIGPDEARAAYDRIVESITRVAPDARILGVLIEEMAPKGVEVILGANRDARFGPLLMFGLGGTFVEVFKDVSFRLAPIQLSSAERMIQQIKAYKILTGIRGNPPCDIGAIEEALIRLSHLVCDHPSITELDINPLIVHPRGEGCSVADSRILLRRLEPAAEEAHETPVGAVAQV
ncbi:MAG: acetate--CoA ligase family protein [bacterium]|nr:acetate--CoA ligase family protein [bacterium]